MKYNVKKYVILAITSFSVVQDWEEQREVFIPMPISESESSPCVSSYITSQS